MCSSRSAAANQQIASQVGALLKRAVIEGSGGAVVIERHGLVLAYFAWWPDQQTFMYFVGNNGEEAVRPVLGSVIDTIQRARTPE